MVREYIATKSTKMSGRLLLIALNFNEVFGVSFILSVDDKELKYRVDNCILNKGNVKIGFG